MNKEQSYLRIFIILLILWCGFLVKHYLFPNSMSDKSIGQSVIQSVSPKVGEIGLIHNKKLSNKEVKERLGRSTWTLLHTMAAVYPAFPTVQHKRDTLQFIYLLSSLFPCAECAGHFQKLLSLNPPQVSSHDNFVQWLCKAHNIVNKRLNKPIQDCTKVEGVWSCGCEAE
ncbi:sulfhydryl oxidase (ERV1p) [Vairimorpha necatrix]|uniref:Sulfhydryl oxidase n=1 Tax=Vairimorpha necatrix TaxID=6039 RepID=A0AAX4J9D1_9MICR